MLFQYGRCVAIGKLLLPVLFVLLLAPGANSKTVTIAALGDSLTEGYGLPVEDGLVPRLEAWLQQDGLDVHIINAGVSGDTTAGGLARADWTMTPDIEGIILLLGGNDFLRGVDPEESAANLSGILTAAQSHGLPTLLVGLKGGSNYGPDYQAAFNGMYPQLAEKFHTIYYPDYFSALRDAGNPANITSTYMQNDYIHPNAAGVQKIVAAFGPVVRKLIEQINK